MNQKRNSSSAMGSATFVSAILLALLICGASAGKLFAAAADSLDQLYEKAKKEGKITLYAPLSPRTMSVVPAAFMKRFPGVSVDHVDATSDKLIGPGGSARLLRRTVTGSRSPSATTRPCPSPNTCTSMWRGRSM